MLPVSATEGLTDGSHFRSAGVVREANRKRLHRLRHALHSLIVVHHGLGEDIAAQRSHGVNG
jgi:hypothetical protein